MVYMLTFTINIPQMLAYIPYMDPMGNDRLMIEFIIFTFGNQTWQKLGDFSAKHV